MCTLMFHLEKHLLCVNMLQAIKLSYKHVSRNLSSTCPRSVGYKLQDNINDCYSRLNVSEDSSMEEVKEAYFKMAKMYHPDSQSSTADQRKFDQVREAYQTIKEHRSNHVATELSFGFDDDDEDEYDLSKLKPQHRPYLENQGIGFGTPSQRKKQYDQHRVSKVFSGISEYRIKTITTRSEESSLVVKDKKAAKKAKISNSMDRLVEDMIQQSMSRGEFDNLSGFGKPLNFKQASPFTDTITEKLNNIMIDSGVQPEWIVLQKEIRMDIQQFRERFAIEKKLLGEVAYTEDMETTLKHHAAQLRRSIEELNVKINRFNLLVPMMTKQMMHYDYNKEYVNIFKHTDEYLPADFDLAFYRRSRNQDFSSFNYGDAGWESVWNDLKAIFSPKKP